MAYRAFDDWYKQALKQPLLKGGREVTSQEKKRLEEYYVWKTMPNIVSPVFAVYDLLNGARYQQAGDVVVKVVKAIRTQGAVRDIELPQADKLESAIHAIVGPVGGAAFDVAEGAYTITAGGKLIPLYLALGAGIIGLILFARR